MAMLDGEKLRSELARCGRPVPEEVRHRAVAFLTRRRSEGRGLKRTAAEIGVPVSTLHHWSTRVQAGSSAMVGFEQIAIVEPVATPAAIVIGDQRSGLRIEVGDAAVAAELIRRLR